MAGELIVDQEAATEVRTGGLSLLEQATGMEVVLGDAESYESANEFLGMLKAFQKKIDETFDPNIKRWHAGHREAVAEKKAHEEPLAKAEAEVKRKMLAWKRDEGERLAAEQRRLQAEAEREAEAERKRQAEAAKKAGDARAAKAILKAPLEVAPVAAPAPVKASGVSIRQEADFEVIDVAAIPRAFMIPDDVKIRKTVRALGHEAKIPGIRIFMRDVMSRRG